MWLDGKWKVNAFELRGWEISVSVSQSQQKAFVCELINDFLIGQSPVRLSNRKHSLAFEPHESIDQNTLSLG